MARRRLFDPKVIEQAMAAPMDVNDAGAETVKDYLKALLVQLLREEDGFSGKRPFGNGGWKYELYSALIMAGVVKGKLDGEGYVEKVEEGYAEELLVALVQSL